MTFPCNLNRVRHLRQGTLLKVRHCSLLVYTVNKGSVFTATVFHPALVLLQRTVANTNFGR